MTVSSINPNPRIENIQECDRLLITKDIGSAKAMTILAVDSVGQVRKGCGRDKDSVVVHAPPFGHLPISQGDFLFIERRIATIEVGDFVVLRQSAYLEFIGTIYEITRLSKDSGHVVGFSLPIGLPITLDKNRLAILKRPTDGERHSGSVCSDCNGIGQIELFTSTVRCRCRSGI